MGLEKASDRVCDGEQWRILNEYGVEYGRGVGVKGIYDGCNACVR